MMQQVLKKTCKKWSPVVGGRTFILYFVLICSTHASTVTTSLQVTASENVLRYYESCTYEGESWFCIPAEIQPTDFCLKTLDFVPETSPTSRKLCFGYIINGSTSRRYQEPSTASSVPEPECGRNVDENPCIEGRKCAKLEFQIPEGAVGNIRACLPERQLEALLATTTTMSTTTRTTKPTTTKPTTTMSTTTMSPLATQQIVQKEIISVKRQEKLQNLLNALCNTIQQQKKQLSETPQQKLEHLVNSLCELTQLNVKHSITPQQKKQQNKQLSAKPQENLDNGYSNPNVTCNEDLCSGYETFSKKSQIVLVVTTAISVVSLMFSLL